VAEKTTYEMTQARALNHDQRASRTAQSGIERDPIAMNTDRTTAADEALLPVSHQLDSCHRSLPPGPFFNRTLATSGSRTFSRLMQSRGHSLPRYGIGRERGHGNAEY